MIEGEPRLFNRNRSLIPRIVEEGARTAQTVESETVDFICQLMTGYSFEEIESNPELARELMAAITRDHPSDHDLDL